MVYRIILTSFFFLFTSFYSFSQEEKNEKKITIHGTVTDANFKNKEGVSVIIRKADRSKFNYSYTDENGEYSIPITYSNKLVIETIYMGYKKQLDTLILESYISRKEHNIILKEDFISLEEIVITANKNISAYSKDTINYNLKNLGLSKNEPLRTVLSKLYGFNVLKDGRIMHLGKNIDKVLISGKEIFINQNKIALDNLEYQMLDSLRVLTRYQDPNDVHFKGKNEESVIDIDITDKYKNIWKLKGHLNGGYNKIVDIGANVLSFGENFSLVFANNYNNASNRYNSNYSYNKIREGNSLTFINDVGNNYFFQGDRYSDKDKMFFSNIIIKYYKGKNSLGLNFNLNHINLNTLNTEFYTLNKLKYTKNKELETKGLKMYGSLSNLYEFSPNTKLRYYLFSDNLGLNYNNILNYDANSTLDKNISEKTKNTGHLLYQRLSFHYKKKKFIQKTFLSVTNKTSDYLYDFSSKQADRIQNLQLTDDKYTAKMLFSLNVSKSLILESNFLYSYQKEYITQSQKRVLYRNNYGLSYDLNLDWKMSNGSTIFFSSGKLGNNYDNTSISTENKKQNNPYYNVFLAIYSTKNEIQLRSSSKTAFNTINTGLSTIYSDNNHITTGSNYFVLNKYRNSNFLARYKRKFSLFKSISANYRLNISKDRYRPAVVSIKNYTTYRNRMLFMPSVNNSFDLNYSYSSKKIPIKSAVTLKYSLNKNEVFFNKRKKYLYEDIKSIRFSTTYQSKGLYSLVFNIYLDKTIRYFLNKYQMIGEQKNIFSNIKQNLYLKDTYNFDFNIKYIGYYLKNIKSEDFDIDINFKYLNFIKDDLDFTIKSFNILRMLGLNSSVKKYSYFRDGIEYNSQTREGISYFTVGINYKF